MGLFKKDAWEDYHKHAAKRDIKVQKAMLQEKSAEEEEKRRLELLHSAFLEQISEFKERINEVKTCNSLNEKISEFMSIYSRVDKIRSQADQEDDTSAELKAKMLLSEIDNIINRTPIPQEFEEQLNILALLTKNKTKSNSLKTWKKQLALSARVKYPDNIEMKPYIDKILGKEIPADASLGTRIKLFLSNMFR